MAGSSGSATGNPRNKVALKPGHSLMDWIRLGNSGADLSGTGGALLKVTREQLAQHKSENDAWICLRGNVYNITRYLDFHPGGVEELMKGAGIDATKLFNQVHSWVNFESILQKCLIGRIVNSSIDEDVFCQPTETTTKKIQNSKDKNQKTELQSNTSPIKFDWSQQSKCVTFYIYLKEKLSKLYAVNIPDNELWVFVNGIWLGWSLQSGSVDWPPTVFLPTSDMQKIELRLEKCVTNGSSIMWTGIPPQLPTPTKDPPTGFCQISIKSITQVNYNVYTVTFVHTERSLHYVPIGHHVSLRGTVKGQMFERQYTPITNLIGQQKFLPGITLMVKSYSDGVFSSWLTSRKVNDVLLVSEPIGTFKLPDTKCTNLILIAAGTGFTPMVRIINWALQPQNKIKIQLLFFNKTEKDIIWKTELSYLMSKSSRFEVEHILSEADSSWKGKRGWVTLQVLQTVLPDFTNALPLPYYVCVCGPISFTQLTERYLQDMNYSSDNYFCFRG